MKPKTIKPWHCFNVYFCIYHDPYCHHSIQEAYHISHVLLVSCSPSSSSYNFCLQAHKQRCCLTKKERHHVFLCPLFPGALLDRLHSVALLISCPEIPAHLKLVVLVFRQLWCVWQEAFILWIVELNRTVWEPFWPLKEDDTFWKMTQDQCSFTSSSWGKVLWMYGLNECTLNKQIIRQLDKIESI